MPPLTRFDEVDDNPFEARRRFYERFAVIEANNGRIEVDSRPGEGSLFTVRLPLSAPPEPPGY